MEFQKHFGIVTVAPNEYVIHMRLGSTVNKGLGQTFFCLPFIDSYIKFPITPRKVNFYADNITKEKQGVGIEGFLIWSIEDGDKAYKKIGMVDTKENCEIIGDGLSAQLNDICVSISRHAISNMDLDEVLTNRESLVARLSEQLDKMIYDWGLKIEAIEIKEVRILSDTLFENMQAPFRNEQLKIAEHSRLEAQKSISNTETETKASVRIRKAEQELQARAIEIDNITKENQIEHEARLKQEEIKLLENIKALENQNEKLAMEKELSKNQALLDKELVAITEDSKRTIVKEQDTTTKVKIQAAAEQENMAKDNEISIKEKDLKFIKEEREEEIHYKQQIMNIQNNISQTALMQVLFEEMGQSMKNMNFDNINWYSLGDNSPMGTLPKAIVEIMALLKGGGFFQGENQDLIK